MLLDTSSLRTTNDEGVIKSPRSSFVDLEAKQHTVVLRLERYTAQLAVPVAHDRLSEVEQEDT